VRALFVIHELALNGAVTALLQQVRRMRARGDHVTVATPQLEGPVAALLPQFRETGAEITRVLDLKGHDIVVGCTIFVGGVLQSCVGRLPTAWWIHEGRVGVEILLGRPQGRQLLQRVGKLIFPSRITMERIWAPLLVGLPPERVEVVPCFVPRPAQGPPAPKRPNRGLVVCVGSVYPRKRQVDLLRAVAMLPNAPLDCALVGEFTALDAPGDDIVRSDPARFILTGGLAPDVVQSWYRAADVFCLPSGDESMPLAPIEAAAHDVPVVLTNLECYEGVWRHGINAMIYPVGDTEMLAWYLRMLMQTPGMRTRLTAAARAVPLRFSEQRSGALFDTALADAIAAFR
jgi:glycosyltransferase involved in cell wall biosynthesis